MGSCFAVMIGEKLVESKFRCLSNPLGILYNPISLHKALDAAISDTKPDPSRTTSLHGRYVHHDYHSEIWGDSADQVMEKISRRSQQLRDTIQSAGWLILTYGTSMLHYLNEVAVANCHKRPSRDFQHSMASYSELQEAATQSLHRLHEFNANLRVIVTVSPVRHVKDTLQVNSLSKSKLRMLCDEVSSAFEFVDYFPSFEIMMDDLRDYRYYGRDLIHPSEEAEDYIWDKFQRRYFTKDTALITDDWEKVRRNLHHRPFNPESADHQAFLKNTLKQLHQLSDKIPVEEEINRVKSLLNDA
jgi:hypothetical protein